VFLSVGVVFHGSLNGNESKWEGVCVSVFSSGCKNVEGAYNVHRYSRVGGHRAYSFAVIMNGQKDECV
jgi:hypothetical protein